MSAISRVCNFNNVSLSSVPYLTVYAIDMYNNKRTLNIYPVARRSARKVSSAFYVSQIIYISVFINAPSRALADKSVDQLLSIIQSQEGALVIEQSGGVRQYTATYQAIEKNNTGVGRGDAAPPQGGYTDFTLEFECSDSYGYDTNYTLIANQSNLTASPMTFPYTQGPTFGADTQVPFIQVQYTAAPGGSTNGTVTIGNLKTGQAVQITRPLWSIYDIIQIDSLNKTVQVNGQDVQFSGAIPEFGLGAATISYQDTFTTRTLKFFAYVYNRYI